MTIEKASKLAQKAKSRKDGVYTDNTHIWAVKNNKFVAYVDFSGNVYQRFGHFVTKVGECNRLERKKYLRNWLKKSK